MEFVITTAGLGPGTAVLEIGCGTGQLTEQLAGRGFRLTAIDIGPSMVAAARRRLAGAEVSFQVTSFEDLVAADRSFDLVISGGAWDRRPSDPEAIAAAGLFGAPACLADSQRAVLAAGEPATGGSGAAGA